MTRPMRVLAGALCATGLAALVPAGAAFAADSYGSQPGYSTAVANSNGCAGAGAFGAFGGGVNWGNNPPGPSGPSGHGADGQATGANNANLCGNPQGTP